MLFQSTLSYLALLAAATQVANAASLEVQYCSSENTGSGHDTGT